ncbi:NAD(P)-dependent dehydrogenase (short-subunit alcohol dehydrogenase family) [Rhodococcus sp. SMB37]|uniref:SDR family oxidoreductase n=1 Tax=Rhodococcus sp. SMB37 TaxID=2512213 RepID=UPI0010447651|nr:SDR family oxidoreductase [Rhodococcus sp. SMB37]TCN50873.1 NAD(P)-dependent dehydrogenase (short-subunit alcohol dehydrogenase family) [Rhodococcus sp. SMB37]
MTLFDAFRFDGKRVLVVGGASGMGAAAAELALSAGAEVVVADCAPIATPGVKAVLLDLADIDSIEAGIAQIGGHVDVVLAAAGVANGTPHLERVNFLGHRLVIERLLDSDMLRSGSAICFISSAAGLGWESNLPALQEFLSIDDYTEASAWAVAHDKAEYMFSKQAVCAYVASQAFPLRKKGIRINAICPGPTDTPLARANAETWLGFGSDYRAKAGIDPAAPIEQAYPLLFLCSDAAAAISGITLTADSGYFSSGMSGSFPAATPTVGFFMGR